MSDVLVECPVCETLRHRSWFDVGERACKACQHDMNLWLDSLAAHAKRHDDLVSRLQMLLNGARPKTVSPKAWGILQRRSYGEPTAEIARALGIEESHVEKLEAEAMGELHAIARGLLTASPQATAQKPEPGQPARDGMGSLVTLATFPARRGSRR
jgi:hypothetical protein